MLRGIHKASANWIGRAVMGVVLGLIAISFGIWGIGDIFRGFGTSTVAKVGRSEIRVEQFRQLYQDRLQQLGRNLGRPILPDQARALGLDRQVLQQMIAENAVDEQVARHAAGPQRRRGRAPDHRQPELQGHHRPVRPRALRAAVAQSRLLPRRASWPSSGARRFASSLIGTISATTAVPKTVLDAFNRFQNEERTIEYVVLGSAQAGDIPPPTPEVLNRFFEERKVVFRAPEYRKITIVTLTAEDLASTIEVSDADLKKAYESRKARFETPGAPPRQADRVPEHGRGARPPPTSSPRARHSRRSPPSADSRNPTSISAPSRKPRSSIARWPTPPSP